MPPERLRALATLLLVAAIPGACRALGGGPRAPPPPVEVTCATVADPALPAPLLTCVERDDRAGLAAAVRRAARRAGTPLVAAPADGVRPWSALRDRGRLAGPLRPSSELALGKRLDVNLATEAELELIPGIGPSRAQAIVGHLETVGPCTELADLVEVRGIGPGTVSRLARFARCGP